MARRIGVASAIVKVKAGGEDGQSSAHITSFDLLHLIQGAAVVGVVKFCRRAKKSLKKCCAR